MKHKNTAIMFAMLISILAIFPLFHTEDPPAQAIEPARSLSAEINKLLASDPVLEGSLAGVSIRSADDGELLYEHMGNTRLQPASLLKLFTAGAALSVLGEDYRFTTEVSADGKVSDGALDGDLYLVGRGDPTLLPADFAEFAREISNKGINRIEGDVVVDDSWYDDIRYSGDLTWNDEHQYYGSQVSALTASPNEDYDAGTVIVNIQPGEKGQSANITISPENDYVTVVNQTKTVGPKGAYNLKVDREHGSNTIFVKGTIPAGAKNNRKWVSVWEPSGYAGDLFKRALEDQGVEVVGKIRTGTATEGMAGLISHKSMPLKDLLVPFMKLSNNGHAEVLVKEMGKAIHKEGSWEKGLEVMNAELAKFGVDPARLVLRDGSGISHANLVPANEITSFLFHVRKEKWFPAFKHSLPVAGDRDRMVGGTMRNRLKEEDLKDRVIAKTGSLTGVSTLSGYVETSSGETLIFAILLNNLIDDTQGRKLENELAKILLSQP
nr:D-alanyl-D-alanine carboxypeptidase/D-alanyl-D-alanine-endopeptidase [Mesobacillus subterraneus]